MAETEEAAGGIGPDHPFLIAGKWAADELSGLFSAVRIGAAVVLTISTALVGFHLSAIPEAGLSTPPDIGLLAAVGAVYLAIAGYGASALAPGEWRSRPDSRALEARTGRYPEAVLRSWVARERAAALKANQPVFAVHLAKLKIASTLTAVEAALAVAAAIAA